MKGDQLPLPVKRKRTARSMILEFNGWASTALIDFLVSIGRDTSRKLSAYDVANIVKEYINNNKLIITGKSVKCDDCLYDLFRRRYIQWGNIQELLERHFLENQYVCSSKDESQHVDSEEESVQIGNNAPKDGHIYSSQTQKVPEPPKSGLAAVIKENIKLVYLRRSVLEELAKVPESFLDKVTGCFVRIKSDPNDKLNKNSHQLQQVKGISSKADNLDSEIHLRLVNYFKDVPLHLLSDGNFTEAECVDLDERFKAGYFKRPTIGELEAKAKILHEDITKHWISKEIKHLQELIHRANEKGWREEMESYLRKRRTLENPAEREKLLSEVPKVIAGAMDTIDINRNNGHGFPRTDVIWHYFDEQGHIQGPVSLNALKRWYDDGFFDENSRVWKTDQTPSDAL